METNVLFRFGGVLQEMTLQSYPKLAAHWQQETIFTQIIAIPGKRKLLIDSTCYLDDSKHKSPRSCFPSHSINAKAALVFSDSQEIIYIQRVQTTIAKMRIRQSGAGGHFSCCKLNYSSLTPKSKNESFINVVKQLIKDPID